MLTNNESLKKNTNPTFSKSNPRITPFEAEQCMLPVVG